jgi:hypothetical protein
MKWISFAIYISRQVHGFEITGDYGVASALFRNFNSLGIHSSYDMSSVILTCYYRHLKQQNFELEKQLKILPRLLEKRKFIACLLTLSYEYASQDYCL